MNERATAPAHDATSRPEHRSRDNAPSEEATQAGIGLTGPVRARDLLRLQRAAGNHATAALLRPTVQRGEVPASLLMSNRDKIDAALKSKDPADVKRIDDVGEATPPERILLIGILLNQWWVGPFDEWKLEALWGSFGDGVLDVAKGNPDLWKQSIERGAELYKLPAVKAISDKFLSDVRAIAGGYLDKNETYCKDELKRLGVAEPGQAGGSPPDQAAADNKRIQELQQGARVMQLAKKAQKSLLDVTVGFETIYTYSSAPPTDEHGNPISPYRVVKFLPGMPPTEPLPPEGALLPPGSTREEAKPLTDVQKQHDALEEIVQGMGAKYPALYSVTANGAPSDLDTVAGDNPEQARAVIVKAMNSTLENITATRGKVAGNLAYELKPIHGQLFSGQMKGPSGVDWTNPVAKPLGEEVVRGYEEVHFWVTMGLATLAAAMFIVAEFATAGMATAALVGGAVGIGVGTAAASWEKAYELRSASQASVSKETELVSSGQADMATFEAVLNTILVFLDVAMAVKPLGRAISGAVVKEAMESGAAAAKGALTGLEAVGSMAAAEAKPLVERAIVELGVESTLKRTGKSAEELIKIVGEESPAGARLKAFTQLPEELAKLPADELARRAGDLGAEVAKDAKTGEALAQLAVERFGPLEVVRRNGGWKALSTALGNESTAGKSIMAFRDGLMGDIEAFVKTLPGGVEKGGEAAVKRTGTQGKFMNDFDISLLGPNSSSNRNALRSFLAGRLGTTPEELSSLLLADFFTDPRRMHLLDQLEPALRQEIASRTEKTAEGVIFAKTLQDAEKAGNKELVEQLRQQMKSLGVEEVAFKPLSAGDTAALYTKMDKLHADLEAAIQAGDKAAQKRLATEIGETQGLINATEGGGYFSGGGVRELVTRKEGLLGGMAGQTLDAQKYTALLDQLPKFYGESNALLKSGYVASEEAVGAIKGVAKYGNRFRELVKDLGVTLPEEARLNSLAEEFQKLLKQAKGESDTRLISRLAEDAKGVQAQVEGLMEQFADVQQEVLGLLSKQANLDAKAVDLAKLQFLTMAEAKYLRSVEAIKQAMVGIITNLTRTAEATPSSP